MNQLGVQPLRRFTFVPILKQNNVTITNTTVAVATAVVVGKLVFLTLKITCQAGAVGTTNTQITVLLPSELTAAATGAMVGSFVYLDSGVASYVGAASFEAGSALSLRFDVHNAGSPLGQVPNFAIAVNDYITIIASYELA